MLRAADSIYSSTVITGPEESGLAVIPASCRCWILVRNSMVISSRLLAQTAGVDQLIELDECAISAAIAIALTKSRRGWESSRRVICKSRIVFVPAEPSDHSLSTVRFQ